MVMWIGQGEPYLTIYDSFNVDSNNLFHLIFLTDMA